eukprot:gene21909-27985_t
MSHKSKAVESEDSFLGQAFAVFSKSLVRPDHPLNSFSTGNLETLSTAPLSRGVNTRDVVIDFYKKHYSANLMKLVIYGKESLDELEGWVTSKFAAVPDKGLTRQVFESDPMRQEQLAKYMEAVPIRDVKTMEIYFPLPAVEKHYLTKPTRYLSHLIGHESAGSILAALKDKQWANGLSCYMYQSLNDFSVFAVSVELSEEGVLHGEEIAECVFAYIGMIQRSGPQQWVWTEIKEAADMSFRFINKTEPSDYCTKLANNMQLYAVPHTVTGDELYFECDSALSMQYLEHLTPRNSIVCSFHRGLAGKTTLKEKWYGTDYNITSVSDEALQRWEAGRAGGSQWDVVLSLPKPNPFIPTDFDLKNAASSDAVKPLPSLVHRIITEAVESVDLTHSAAEEEEVPVSVDAVSVEDVKIEESTAEATTAPAADEDEDEEEEEGEEEESAPEASGASDTLTTPPGKQLVTWFQPDTTWEVPKVNVNIALENLFATSSPLNVAFAELAADCLKEVLADYSYYADCAGLHYHVALSKGGITLQFYGYQHKLPVLVAKAVEELRRMGSGDQSAIKAELYDRLREKALRTYKNYVFWQPYYHCIANSLNCLEDPRWSHAEKYTALKASSIADFISFVATFLRSLKAEVLVYGNATKEEAVALSTSVLDILKFDSLPSSQEHLRRSVQLAPGTEYVLRGHSKDNNPNEVNSGIENIYLVDRVGGLGASFTEGVDRIDDLSHPIVMEAMLELVTHIISEPAFDQLRTKEQLGYIVHAGTKQVGQTAGLHIIIQSGVKDPHYLNNRVEEFLTAFRVDLAAYSEEKFASFVTAVVEKLIEKPKNIDEESGRYWEEIRTGRYLFDRKKQLCGRAPVHSGFYDRYLLDRALRVKFSSQFYGSTTKYHAVTGANTLLVRDMSVFKRTVALHPVQVYEPELSV